MRWRGLVALNTLAYLATTAMVFWYAQKYAATRGIGWLAAITYALCGFSVEYALGVWPQMLSVALCTGGVIAAGEFTETGRLRLAALAGFLLAFAAGVRYQNAAVLGTVGVALVVWSRKRFLGLSSFALGALVPLTSSAIFNHARFGSWNPISKGGDYINVPFVQNASTSWLEPLIMFWARVGDYSTRPFINSDAFQGWLTYDTPTGGYLVFGLALKKALLQSAPWAGLGLLTLCAGWIGGRRESRWRQVRMLSAVTAATLLVFSFAGLGRDEGLSFNQRYFLELVPFLAIGFAWGLDGFPLPVRSIVIGSVLGGLAVLALLFMISPLAAPGGWLSTVKIVVLLKVPLILAAGLIGLWLVPRARVDSVIGAVAGICLGWAFVLHVSDDVRFDQGFRNYHLGQTNALDRLIPDRSALVVNRATGDEAGVLAQDRDVVILQTAADDGADATTLIRALLNQKRRVFLIDRGFAPEVRERVTRGLLPTPVGSAEDQLIELIHSH